VIATESAAGGADGLMVNVADRVTPLDVPLRVTIAALVTEPSVMLHDLARLCQRRKVSDLLPDLVALTSANETPERQWNNGSEA
jgi:hypothetical protein